MINLGIIGCGYWGPNLLRNFWDIPDTRVQLVAELDQARLQYLTQRYPILKTTKNYKDVFTADIDAVVIATPAATHYRFAKEALLHKKHVLVEKPLAMNSVEAEELIELAEKKDCKLMVGHTFEYNEAVRALKKYIQTKEIGRPYYLYSQRLNLGIVRQDVNALWNLAPHDISILIYLLEKMPLVVSAKGNDFLQHGIDDVVFLTLHFPDDILAHVQVSWLDPNKVRRMTLVGSEKMIVYDDISDTKIKVFEKGLKKQNIKDSLGGFDNFGEFQLIKSAGNVVIPKIKFVEPLSVECAHFIDVIRNNKIPLTDGRNGWRVVKVLEAAQKSLEQNGANVEVGSVEAFRKELNYG